MSLTKKLVGHWDVRKIISGDNSFVGVAQIQHAPDSFLSFFEQGHLNCRGHQISGSFASYLFKINGVRLDVHYASDHRPLYQSYAFRKKDGRLFAGPVEHVCNDDLYISSLSFPTAGKFVWTHDVKGPRKNYTIMAKYQRKKLD